MANPTMLSDVATTAVASRESAALSACASEVSLVSTSDESASGPLLRQVREAADRALRRAQPNWKAVVTMHGGDRGGLTRFVEKARC